MRRLLGWGLRCTLAAFLLAMLLGFFAHPWLAVSRPSGGDVLVSEGWLPRHGLRAVARRFQEGGYRHLYITGTVRPFSYYLAQHEGVGVVLDSPMHGEVAMSITGLPGARWALLADGDTLLTGTVGRSVEVVRAAPAQAVQELRLLDVSAGSPGPGTALLFVRDMTIGGENVHGRAAGLYRLDADGVRTAGWPTHAEQALVALAEQGVPLHAMTAVPCITSRDRTRSAALTFAGRAREDGIAAFDVVTLGVHARRTWIEFRRAAGGEASVGIIALPDPACGRWNWWRSRKGWMRVLKEFLALPRTWWG